MTWIALSYVPRVALLSHCSHLEAKAQWLHWACQRVIRIFNLEIRSQGSIPGHGLLVSNHLSYLDVLVISALTPSVFVAKREVKTWPIFGFFARLAGTLFVDRCRRIQADTSARELETVLSDGRLAVLFPEGTSSDGQHVLPFRSALLEPVANCRHPISVSAMQYELNAGNVQEEVCYWKNMTLLPHLLNLLSKPALVAHVRFLRVERRALGRKVLARQLHAEVLRLNNSVRTLLSGARAVNNGVKSELARTHTSMELHNRPTRTRLRCVQEESPSIGFPLPGL